MNAPDQRFAASAEYDGGKPAAKILPAEMPLHKLRRARGLSQRLLADLMNVKQPIVAKQEHQENMHISTLRSHIEAMGGKLEIVARFPEGAVRISNF
jgi:hypothetical protein